MTLSFYEICPLVYTFHPFALRSARQLLLPLGRGQQEVDLTVVDSKLKCESLIWAALRSPAKSHSLLLGEMETTTNH